MANSPQSFAGRLAGASALIVLGLLGMVLLALTGDQKLQGLGLTLVAAAAFVLSPELAGAVARMSFVDREQARLDAHQHNTTAALTVTLFLAVLAAIVIAVARACGAIESRTALAWAGAELAALVVATSAVTVIWLGQTVLDATGDTGIEKAVRAFFSEGGREVRGTLALGLFLGGTCLQFLDAYLA